jgi:hypothetical protein
MVSGDRNPGTAGPQKLGQQERSKMSALAIALTVLGCTLAAALAGLWLRGRLPEAHRDGDSSDVVKAVMGLIATMAALVLGLLIASALSSYNTQNTNLRKLAADILQQDRYLAMYGPETEDLRDQLRQLVATAHDQIWSPTGVKMEYLTSQEIRDRTGRFLATVASLSPKTELQSFAQKQALQFGEQIGELRALIVDQGGGAESSWLFLVALVFWVSVLFLGFGLVAPFHATNVTAISLGALSVSVAVFVILELGEPYRGFIQLPDLPRSRRESG